MTKLMVIGGGRMGEALVQGLVTSGWTAPNDITVVEPVAARRGELTERLGVGTTDELVAAEGVVLAVKPAQVVEVCTALGQLDKIHRPRRVLSIAAGITLATIEGALPTGVTAVRAMPNTPALVGAGASAISGGATTKEADFEWAASILESVGTVVRVPEPLIDAVTGLSGSGPAYVFLIAEALIDAGVLNGLPRDTAVALANQTLLGASRLLTETEDSAAELRAAVTSPGGTTAAGLRSLETAGVRAAIIDAVTAAAERARELGA